MAGQNKASMRQKMRSAVAHKRLADQLLDSLLDTQVKLNGTLAKIDADNPVSLDTDYEADGALVDTWEADGQGTDAQHKASLRDSLRSALAHRQMADEIADALEELQAAYTALLVKLDAEAGTLDDTDYESTLAVSVLDADDDALPAQHKAKVRRSLRSALANEALADEVLDAISGAQTSFNAALVLLDAGTITPGDFSGLEVTPIQPD